MADHIDMSLDDVVKRSAEAAAALRRNAVVRNPARATPYPIPQVRQRSEDAFTEMVDSGTKLYISNLCYSVSDNDIKLLFSEDGELKRCSVHYDQSGRSMGTAEAVFARHSDALEVIKKYNNMILDGMPLKIELVGASSSSSSSSAAAAVRPLCQMGRGRPNDYVHLSIRERLGGSGLHNEFAQGHFPRGRGEEKDHNFERVHRHQRRGHAKVKGNVGKLTVKDLDDDLERYHSEANQSETKRVVKKNNAK